MSEGQARTPKQEKLKETLDFYRGMLLDSLDLLVGEKPEWPKVRSCVLKVFGDRGIESKMNELIKD